MTEEVTTFEDILEQVGDRGWWQIRNFLLVVFATFPAALQTFAYVYLAAVPDHWCHIQLCEHSVYEVVKNLSIPILERHGDNPELSKCSQFEMEEFVSAGGERCLRPSHFTNRTVSCAKFDFDRSVFQSTIVTEWNLVCDKEFWRSTSQAIYVIGQDVGVLIFGFASDMYGRKRAVMCGTFIGLLFGGVLAFSPNFPTFLVARFLVAVGTVALFGIPSVLIIENVGPKWRGMMGVLFSVPFGLGYASTAVFAYFIRSWRYLQLAIMVPLTLYLIMIYFVPESPRWLVSKGRVKEAEAILVRAAKMNRREDKLRNDFGDSVETLAAKERRKDGASQSRAFRDAIFQCLTLFKTPKMRRRMLALTFCRFAMTFVYNSGAFIATNLSADIFLYTLVSGLIEIPSYFLALPLIRYAGRRITLVGFFLACSAALFTSLFVPSGSIYVRLLAWAGLCSVGGAYALIFPYTAELLPTSVRSYGMGIADFFATTGSVGGVYMAGLVGGGTIPLAAMATASFAAAFAALMLPETRNCRLPETVEDVEAS